MDAVETSTDLFIGRDEDLEFLDGLYSNDSFCTCAIMGRRRIGKTTLLEEFCKDRRNLFFRFRRSSIVSNLMHISRTLSVANGDPPKDFVNLEYALDAVTKECEKARTVVVFDEYPFISAIDESVSSDFQHFVDGLHRTRTMVVFCGSSISGMKKEFNDRSSPLYGRIQAKRVIGPLPYRDCREFHRNMDELDAVRLYLTVGGVPLYHMMLREPSYRECIARHFIGNGADLTEEAENIIMCELSPGEKYVEVVEAVADGCVSLKRISERTGFPKSTCSRYLSNLENVGVVDRVIPMSMGKGIDPPYSISDNLVAFNYEVVGKFAEMRSYGDPLGSYDTMYEDISSFLGKRFERMCEDFVRCNYITLKIGRWWGRIDGESTDIDIVARVSDGSSKYDLYCKCKFRRKPTTYATYSELKDTVEFVNRNVENVNERYVIFSASGFADSLLEAEEDDPRLILVDLDTLTGRKPPKPLH